MFIRTRILMKAVYDLQNGKILDSSFDSEIFIS